MKFWQPLVACIFAYLVIGCEKNPEAPSPTTQVASAKVTLQLNWKPEPQFGAFYAAKESGAFTRHNLDVDIVPGPNVGESGVQWRVRAKAQQYASGDAAQMRAALTGRGLEDVDAVAAARGFKKVNVETWPSWWPRLPVLDSRITIKVEAPITAGAP